MSDDDRPPLSPETSPVVARPRVFRAIQRWTAEHKTVVIPLGLTYKHRSYRSYRQLALQIQQIIDAELAQAGAAGWEPEGMTNFDSLRAQDFIEEQTVPGNLFRSPRTHFGRVTLRLRKFRPLPEA